MDTFSDRNNIPIPQSEITIRQDAPLELREWLFSPSFKDAELTVHICASLISYFK